VLYLVSAVYGTPNSFASTSRTYLKYVRSYLGEYAMKRKKLTSTPQLPSPISDSI
jgi:hypothetical protein